MQIAHIIMQSRSAVDFSWPLTVGRGKRMWNLFQKATQWLNISSNCCVRPAIKSEVCDRPCFYGEWHCLCLLRKMDCGAALCVQTALLFRLNYAFTDFLPTAPTCKISTGTIQINTEKIVLFAVRGGDLATAQDIQRWICTAGMVVYSHSHCTIQMHKRQEIIIDLYAFLFCGRREEIFFEESLCRFCFTKSIELPNGQMWPIMWKPS